MEPFLGQIQAFGFDYPPLGWAECNGQLLPVSQNSALFSLLGTTYGGDGRTTFGLPDLRGRSMVHQGTGPGLTPMYMGQTGGVESVTLSVANMPSHSHTATLYGESAAATAANPKNKMLASPTTPAYAKPNSNPDDNKKMAADSIIVDNTGGGQPFGTRNPYLVVNICIATVGVFPSRE